MSENAVQQAPPTIDPDTGEDLVAPDDAVIGRALRWSLLAVIVIGVIVTGAILYVRRAPAAPPQKLTLFTPPTTRPRPETLIPNAPFNDITASSGITFVHNNGAYGDKLLPETMGGGVAFLDYDNDNLPDLLFINSTYWPNKLPAGKSPTTSALYHNEGNGRFKDVTAGSGLDVPLYGMGLACGDYDNDGRVDVLITTVGGCKLFHNEGTGKFRDVTQSAGVGGSSKDWATSAAFLDFDNDGDLDLFVCNYIRWSPEIDREVGYSLIGIGRAYGPPTNFQGAFCNLYRNEGGGKFTDVSEKAGVQVRNTSALGVPVGKSLGVMPVDLDNDGYLDLIVANDTVQNFVFHNEKNGTFKEIGAGTGIAFDSYGAARGAMGIDAARFRNNNVLGIGIGNFANEMTAMYVSTPADPLLFTDEAIAEGVGPASRLPLKFGLFFFDYDLDGWQDLLTANGHLEEEIGKVQQSQTYKQSAQLFWNAGANAGGGFVSVEKSHAGADLFKPIVGRGSAFADIDNDGDLDVVLTQVAGPPLLLRNDQTLNHHWVRLKLTGDGAKINRDAIGATIKLTAAGVSQYRTVMAARSYLSQSELAVTFGLGQTDKVDAVEITWPGGKVQKLDNVAIDRVTTVTPR
jgi:hypothetical protein